MKKQIPANFLVSLSFLLFVIATTTGNAVAQTASPTVLEHAEVKPKPLTSDQQKYVDQMVAQYEKSCLAGPPLPDNIDLFTKTVVSWTREPATCSCVATRMRTAMTPAVFAYTKERYGQFMEHFAMVDVAECGVPSIKKHFAESCEQLIGQAFSQMSTEKTAKRIAELGYKDVDSMLKGSCDCIRTSIRDITPEQWAESSFTKYHEYLERKRTGQPAGKTAVTPLDEAMGTCIKPAKAQ